MIQRSRSLQATPSPFLAGVTCRAPKHSRGPACGNDARLSISEAKRAPGGAGGREVGGPREGRLRGDEHDVASVGVKRGGHDHPVTVRARPRENPCLRAGKCRTAQRPGRTADGRTCRDDERRPPAEAGPARAGREEVDPPFPQIGERVEPGRPVLYSAARPVLGRAARQPATGAAGKAEGVSVAFRDERRPSGLCWRRKHETRHDEKQYGGRQTLTRT